MLKTGIALLAWFLGFTIIVETLERLGSTGSRGLTSLGIETSGKGKGVSKYRAIDLQIVLRDVSLIHPQAQALVADELHHADRFIYGSILLLGTVHFVLVDQH